jgi:hypothetical protein
MRAPSIIPPVEPGAATRPPRRPDPRILCEAIPLFFIGQNRDGFWVARDADGRVGGIFLRKQSALKFADKNAPPVGCAKMVLSGRFELDIENKGNPLVARLGAAKRVLTRLAQRPTAFIGTATRQDSRLRSMCMIGRDSKDNWVVQEPQENYAIKLSSNEPLEKCAY